MKISWEVQSALVHRDNLKPGETFVDRHDQLWLVCEDDMCVRLADGKIRPLQSFDGSFDAVATASVYIRGKQSQ